MSKNPYIYHQSSELSAKKKIAGTMVPVAKRGYRSKEYERAKKIRKAKRERAEKKKEELYWVQLPDIDTEESMHLVQARDRVADFIQRTGRRIELDKVHRLAIRQERYVLDIANGHFISLLPPSVSWNKKGKERKRHPVYNKVKLQEFCCTMRVPYWREMRVEEMRGVLLLLAYMEGARFRDKFEEGSMKAVYKKKTVSDLDEI